MFTPILSTIPTHNRPLHVILPCGEYCLELLKFAQRKVNEYLTFVDSATLTVIINSHLEIPGVSRFYPRGIQKYVLNELIEATANLTCFNIVIRAITNELVTLFVIANNPDTMYANFTVDYKVDQKKLIEMLISNETYEPYTSVMNRTMPNEDPLIEYMDSFNISMLRTLYSIFTYIINTSKQEFMSLIMNIGNKVHTDIEDCASRGIISSRVKPYSVFVSPQTFDIVVVNT